MQPARSNLARSEPGSRALRSRRPAAPDLHLGHDRQAEGRAAHARELLLDEPLVRPRDRRRGRTTSCCRCCRSSTAAAGTCSRSSRGGRARRSCSSAASTPARALELIERERDHDDDGRAGELPLHGAGAAASPTPTSRRCGSPSSAARRCRRRCSTRGPARGVDIVQGYGLTEAAPNVLCLPPEDARRKAGLRRQAVPVRELRPLRRGRAARARPERLPRLLAQRRGDRRGVPRRLAADRRRRRARRRGQLPDPRPAEGHGRLRRRERLPGRDRGGAARASRRRRRRRRRRARRALGRGLRGVRRPRVARLRRRAARALPRAARALQGAEELPRRRRAAAQLDGEDPEVRADGCTA